MNYVDSIEFVTEDGESISLFFAEALSDIDDQDNVTLQVPIFADGRSGHMHMSLQEAESISRNIVIRRAAKWALNTRMTKYEPRTSN